MKRNTITDVHKSVKRAGIKMFRNAAGLDKWINFQARVRAIIENHDGNYLIQLGRAVNKMQSTPQYDPLDELLVTEWAGPIMLCSFSDSALLDYCCWKLGNDDLTFDNIRKRRQRLGLVKLNSKPLITGVKFQNDRPVFSYSRQFKAWQSKQVDKSKP